MLYEEDNMTVLQIYLRCSDGKQADLEMVFRDAFVPAISARLGFRRVFLMRSVDDGCSYQIELAFESEELRKQWVASREHEQAFPRIRELCDEVSHARFEAVSETVGEA